MQIIISRNLYKICKNNKSNGGCMGDDKKDKEVSGVIGNYTKYLSYIYENQIKSFCPYLFHILNFFLMYFRLC